nr:transcriptional regulator [Amycolatopsis anabasis]
MTTNMPARMLRLLTLLQSRREWTGAELAERLEVTGRTVRRDIERLRELGYPVEGTTGTSGGYRLASGRNLPPLVLDDDEAVAVAAGLLTAAGGSVSGIEETSVRALAKLEQVLPARLRQQVAAVAGATVPVFLRGGPRAEPATLAVLATACRDHELLSFEYTGRDGTPSSRRVEPHHLVTVYGRWYLIAYDPDRDGWRTFRADRLAHPSPTHRRFTPRELPAPDAATYLARTLTSAPYRYTAELTVHAAAPVVSGRLGKLVAQIPGRVDAADSGTCTVRLGGDDLDLVAQHLMAVTALGHPFTLDQATPELRDHVHTLTGRLHTATAPPGS